MPKAVQFMELNDNGLITSKSSLQRVLDIEIIDVFHADTLHKRAK